MKLSKRTKRALNINLTSLIDVLFILLLFFIVTSTFKDPNTAALDLILPKANKTSDDKESDEAILFLDKNQQVSFLGHTIPLDSLESRFPQVLSELANKTIMLKGDESISYQSFITVFDILKLNKVDKLVLAAKKKTK
ncbi:MAG: biopolymer transporter ExbD [Calditrichaeota bacterium]|nr:biopolymer transporter ExbD [Calditrichota bacterium]